MSFFTGLKRIVLLSIVLAAFSACSSSSGGGSGKKTGDILLTVVDGTDDTVLVADARVLVIDALTSEPVGVVNTDNNGEETITLDPGQYQFKISAQGYQSSPPANISPVPVDLAVKDELELTIRLYPLADSSNTGGISGVVSEGNSDLEGALVVAKVGTEYVSVITSDDGSFELFNVPAGTAEVSVYKAGVNVEPLNVAVTAGEVTIDQELTVSADATGNISGSVNPVACNSCDNAIDITLLHPGTRDVIPGMRVYTDAGNDYDMPNVPDGTYDVIASLENDSVVLDPNESVQQGLPAVTINADSHTVDFKVTEAIPLISPARDSETGEIAVVSTTPTFSIEKIQSFASADDYVVVVYDESGTAVWGNVDIDNPLVTVENSAPINIPYNFDGSAEALEPGRYYQLRVYARSTYQNQPNIWESTSEDLEGLFQIEEATAP